MERGTTRPSLQGIRLVAVLLSVGAVLARSSSIPTKAVGTGIVTWCMVSLLQEVFSHE